MTEYSYVKWTNPKTGKTVTTHTDNPERAARSAIEKYGATDVKVYKGRDKPERHVSTYKRKRADVEKVERLGDIGIITPDAPPVKKFEIAVKYGELKDVPVSEYHKYKGGVDYLKSLPLREKKEKLKEYMHSEEWESFISSPKGQQQFKDVKSSIAREGLGPLDMVFVETVPTIEVEEKIAHIKLFSSPEETEEKIWISHDVQTRFRRVFAEGIVSGGLAIPTIIETGLSYITGEEDILNVFERIKTGKTPKPFTDWQQKHFVSYTPGLIEAPISELITGGESDAFERLSNYERIGESVFKTGATFMGFIAGGGIYGFGKAKVGRITKLIESKYDINILQYKPSALLRKGYWKLKERFGKAKYIPEEKTWDYLVLAGKKKFAEVSGAKKQVSIFERTRSIDFFPDEDIVTIHTTDHALGKLIKIRAGGSETPGLSVSAFGRGSPHFLRASGGYGSSNIPSSISLFPQLHKPTAPLFSLKTVVRLPKNIRTNFFKASEYLKGLKKGPYAHIAPKVEMGGPELEAIIKSGTIGIRKSSYYYTTYKGMVVPLPQYKLLGSYIPKNTIISGSSKIPIRFKKFISLSYQSKPSVPLIRPSYVISKVHSKKSYVSTDSYSYKSNYKSSIPISIIKSIVSYKSSFSSSKKSYKPSSSPDYKSNISSGKSSTSSIPSSSTPVIIDFVPYSVSTPVVVNVLQNKGRKNVYDKIRKYKSKYRFREHGIGIKEYKSPFKKGGLIRI